MSESNRVTFHHEGAGSPTDNVARFLNTDNYSIGIGVTRYEVRRSPRQSFRTTGQPPGPSLQVCFSGNRSVHPLRDEDLQLARLAINEARHRGWIPDNPDVYLHGDTDSTQCPGVNTKARRAELVAIAKNTSAAPAPVPPPTTQVFYMGETVTKFKWNGNLDAQGNGYFDVPGVAENQVVGLTPVTRNYDDPTPLLSVEYGAPLLRVQIKHGKPSGNYTIHVAYV